jgi:SAM-dependent methyltransferase
MADCKLIVLFWNPGPESRHGQKAGEAGGSGISKHKQMNVDSKFNPLPAAVTAEDFSFRRAFARHWRASVRYYGLRHTIAQLAAASYRFLRELLPDRRKIQYGDLDYDFDHSVDTTRSNVSFRSQLIAALSGHQYFPTEPWLFDEMMAALPIRFQDFTFVDLGSGKGRALLMAATYGFKRIIGVEYMPEWHRAAEENVRKFAEGRAEVSAHERCGAAEMMKNEGTDKSVCATKAPLIECLCLDARDFEFPAGPLVVYLFNPFPEPVLAAVLDRLRQSLLMKPRPVFVAYRFPEFDALLQKCAWLEKIAGTQQWAAWKNRRHRA